MAVNLSFIGGAGWQFFDNNGDPLTGGKVYTYAAGSSTPLTTYTSRNGLTANANPIILDAAGRTPEQIWSTEGLLYKYVITDANNVVIRTWDNIGGSVVASDLAQDLANATDPVKGDALIGFRQSDSNGNLTGSVNRTVHQKLQEFVSVLDFGVVGDGVVDDTVNIQKSLDAISLLGGTLFFPARTYKCTTELTLSASNVSLVGETGAVLDFSTASAGNTALRISGAGRTTSAALSANAVEGEYTVTLVSNTGSNFSEKSWVQITAEDAYDFNGTSLVKRGEIKYLLKKPSADVLQFDTHIYENYTTANLARVYNVSFIENVTVSGLSFVGIGTEAGNDYGIRAFWVNNLNVENCRFIDFEFYALAFQNCIHSSARNNYFDGVRYESSAGAIFYGFVVLNNTQWFTTHGNIGRELRHLVTTTSTTTDYGQPYFGTISNNVMESAIAGDQFSSFAYENHGFGRFINWIGNVADSCFSGFNFELGDQVAVGNVVRGCRAHGFVFGDTQAGRNLQNLIISNNYIDLATTDVVPAGTFFGFFFPNNVNSERRNIIISNNTVTNTNATSRPSAYGVRVLGGSSPADNCVISGNTFNNVTEFSPSDFCIRVEQANWTITNNNIRNFQRAIYLSPVANNITINGNTLVNDTYSGTFSFIQVLSNKCAIVNNVFRNSYRTITVDSGAVGTKISGNAEFDIAQPIANSGTGTQIGSYAAESLIAPVTFPGAAGTATNSNYYIFNRGAAQTIVLPDPTLFSGRILNFKNIQAQTVDSTASNVVPIDSATPGTAILPAVDGAWATAISDGTNWIIMQRG